VTTSGRPGQANTYVIHHAVIPLVQIRYPAAAATISGIDILSFPIISLVVNSVRLAAAVLPGPAGQPIIRATQPVVQPPLVDSGVLVQLVPMVHRQDPSVTNVELSCAMRVGIAGLLVAENAAVPAITRGIGPPGLNLIQVVLPKTFVPVQRTPVIQLAVPERVPIRYPAAVLQDRIRDTGLAILLPTFRHARLLILPPVGVSRTPPGPETIHIVIFPMQMGINIPEKFPAELRCVPRCTTAASQITHVSQHHQHIVTQPPVKII